MGGQCQCQAVSCTFKADAKDHTCRAWSSSVPPGQHFGRRPQTLAQGQDRQALSPLLPLRLCFQSHHLCLVNDQKTLRQAKGKNDLYIVFKKMLHQVNPPDDWDELLDESGSEYKVDRL